MEKIIEEITFLSQHIKARDHFWLRAFFVVLNQFAIISYITALAPKACLTVGPPEGKPAWLRSRAGPPDHDSRAGNDRDILN